ncbi:unnamed protein product [Rhizophagus irregularis]|nr:unnamed protein product [Rhizophagus irregularis]
MQYIVSTLKALIFQEQNKQNSINFDDIVEISSEEYESSEEIDRNRDLSISSTYFTRLNSIKPKSYSSFQNQLSVVQSKMSEEYWDGEPKSRINIRNTGNKSNSKINDIDDSSDYQNPKLAIITSDILKELQKLELKGQDWFNEKYSKKENLDIVGSKRLNFVGSLKIKDFTKSRRICLTKLKLTKLYISGCFRLTKVDLSGLSKLTSLSLFDCSKLTEFDFSLTGLTKLKMSSCYQLEKFDLSKFPKLTSLSVIDCPKLTKLNCSKSKLIYLKVSNLNELNCSNTSIKKLNLNLCPDIQKLNCSNNNNLISLDVSNCFQLELLNCFQSKLTNLDLRNCPESIEVIKPPDCIITRKEKIKNILIIGCTGSGKSTLANVLTGTNGRYVGSHFQKGVFEWKGAKYRVIDTTGLSITEEIYSIPEGISQVLFVVDRNFADGINMLKLFESDIFKYTTIVRTKFRDFKNRDICEKNKEKLCGESETNAKIIKSCKGVIYVDNPPTKILSYDYDYDDYDYDDDDDDDNDYIRINIKKRMKSRTILLNHLKKVCREKVLHMKFDVSTNNLDFIPQTLTNNQQMIQQLKLTHGLFLNGYDIQPSEQAIVTEKGKLDMSLYNGQPIVYTNINDSTLSMNLLNFNSDEYNFINTLQPSDLCINFPIAEITYNSNLSESFSKYTDNDEQLYKLYGHFFARKTLIGGRLFIKELNLATLAQIDLFKFYIFWAYNSAKHDIEYINNLPISYLPRINTLDGLLLDTPEKISNWLNNLYQNNVFDIISYKNLIPITQFKNNPLTEENFEEKQPGVSNFKEKLSLKEWVENVIYINLVRWIKDFHFLQGRIITKFYKMEVSKKIAASFIKLPIVKSSNKSYLEIIRPTKKVEEFLINNNIFSIKDLSSSPFINIIQPNDSSHNDYNFLIKFEQYEIHINGDHIKSSTEFEQAINNALNNMKPFKALHDVFDEYGHVFPQKIILGRSFKRNITTTYDISNRIDFKSETLESYLDKLNISYLLTRSGNIIENHELLDLMQNLNDDLEIIELDNIISLYEILDKEQQGKINNIITKYKQDNHRIIMSGITDLKDLDNNNTDHYKRINIQPSLEDENYEVIGSIISKKKNSKLEEFLLKFGLYDFNGFSAMIKTLKNTNIKIEECYILWMIIGIPSKLSVLSPRNHDLQVKYESVTLQPNQIKMKAPISLSQEYIISVNAHHSYETINIRVVEWSENCIRFQINGSTCNNSNINFNIDNIDDSNSFIMSDNDSDTQQELENNFSTIIETVVNNIDCNICILRSDYKTFRIDNGDEEYPLDLIGYKLSEENFNKNLTFSDE